MATTALLVEIVIVGMAFFFTILPIVAAILSVSPCAVFEFFKNVPIHFQIAAAYGAGIVWNRICDQSFHPIDNYIIRARFSSRKAYQAARTMVLLRSDSIREHMANHRSLIRVSRALSLLLSVYVIATPIYLLISEAYADVTRIRIATIVLLELALLVGSVYAWFRLARGYVFLVSDAHSAIVTLEDKKQEGSSGNDD